MYDLSQATVAPLLYVVKLEAEPLSISEPIHTQLATGEAIEGHHGNFNLDGKYFYFCNCGSGSNLTGITVDIFDAQTRERVTRIETAALNTPAGDGHAYISPDGKTVAIAKYGTNVLTLLDEKNNWAATELAVGTGIQIGHISFVPSGTRAKR